MRPSIRPIYLEQSERRASIRLIRRPLVLQVGLISDRKDKVVALAVYDGAMRIGGNKLYLEENGDGVFLDFGKNFGKYGVFYEEFLKNRDTVASMISYISTFCSSSTSTGRTSFHPPRNNPIPPLNVATVLLSHAHKDHCGNIGNLGERRD